jgi:hypothetical protein
MAGGKLARNSKRERSFRRAELPEMEAARTQPTHYTDQRGSDWGIDSRGAFAYL